MFSFLVNGILWDFEFWTVLFCLQACVTEWAAGQVAAIVDIIQTIGYGYRNTDEVQIMTFMLLGMQKKKKPGWPDVGETNVS